MAEHTDRKTGARGVLRRTLEFAKRKLKGSATLNTNNTDT